MSEAILAEPAKYLRAVAGKSSELRIDRKGGYRNAGIIRGVSVITKGEALGHEMWIDDTFLDQVNEAINQRNKGIKSRFTHPGLSGDGLGKHVGRVMAAEVMGDQVIADQHFTESGHSTPDGDLAGYLMDLAEEDGEAYGLSIVFGMDLAEMEAFQIEHSDGGEWISPDALNVNNYPHARLAELRAADAVDEPAANPNGLFNRDQEIAQEATAIAEFALGLSEEKPTVAALGIDAERARDFVNRFLETNNYTIQKDTAMDQGQTPEVTEQTPATPATPAEPASKYSGQDYLDAFGDQGGVWFAQGKSFDQCLAETVKHQKEEIEKLKNLSTVPAETGEETPVDFEAEDKPKGRAGFASKIKIK